MVSNPGSFLIYQSESGKTQLDVRLAGETVWLTHCKGFLQVQNEGERQVRRTLKHYNLDAIISVGYRIKSHTATRFRQWATQQLKEYIVKGFVLDDERLKNPDHPSFPRSSVGMHTGV